jgi:hypothetical protein
MKLSESLGAKKPVAIYPGRFQPFGLHHFKTYKKLVNKFGKENVYIATSDVVNEKSPFSFRDKKFIISKHGVPSSKIVKVKSPYKSEEIISKLSSQTPVVFAFGTKDAGRLKKGKYFDLYNDSENMLPNSEKGYIYVLPHISLKVQGNELSGTEIRSIFGSDLDEKNKKLLFKKIMGFYDNNIYSLFVSKLS